MTSVTTCVEDGLTLAGVQLNNQVWMKSNIELSDLKLISKEVLSWGDFYLRKKMPADEKNVAFIVKKMVDRYNEYSQDENFPALHNISLSNVNVILSSNKMTLNTYDGPFYHVLYKHEKIFISIRFEFSGLE